MAISFACGCGKQLRTADENAGKRVKCPSCGQPVAVPAAAPSRGAKGSPSKSSAMPPPAREPAPGMIRFGCDCGKQLQARAEQAGRRIKCPGCGAELVVPRGGDDGIQTKKPAAKKSDPAAAMTAAPKPKRKEPPPKLRDEDEEPPERDDEDEEDEEERPRAGKRKRGKKSPLPLILGGVAAVLLLAGGGFAVYHFFFKGEDPKPPVIVPNGRPGPQAQLAPDLDLVPRDAAGFASVRVGRLWGSPLVQKLQPLVKLFVGDRVTALEKQLDLTVGEVDRATLVLLAPDDESFYLIISTSKPYDKDKLVKTLLPDAQEKQHGGKSYHLGKEGAVHFINDRLLVGGPPPGVEKFLAKPVPTGATGPLSDALKMAAQDHHLVVGANPPAQAMEDLRKSLPPQYKQLEPLLDTQGGTLTASLGDDLQLDLHLNYNDEAKAKEGLKAAQGAVFTGRLALNQFKEEAKQSPEQAELLKTLAPLEKSLDTMVLEQNGSTVRLGLKTEGGLGTIVTALAPLVMKQVQGAANQTVSANNLRQLALAMHQYHDTLGHLPAGVRSKDGQPLLSWRVELLPFLGEKELYDQFNREQPWNSPHNMKLLSKMPKVFMNPERPAPGGSTFYQVLVNPLGVPYDRAKSAPFGGPQPPRLTDFTDGTSNTILIVEANQPVPWTKPEDLPYNPSQPILPRLGNPSKPDFWAAFADGAVKPIKRTIDQQVLRNLITPADGNPVPNLDQ